MEAHAGTVRLAQEVAGSGVGGKAAEEQECGELTWRRSGEEARLDPREERLALRHRYVRLFGMEVLIPLAPALGPPFLPPGDEWPSTDLSELRGLCRGYLPHPWVS